MSAAMDALINRGWNRTVLVCRLVVSIVSLALFTGFAYWSVSTIDRTMALARKTQSLILLIWPFQFCLALAFGLMALTTLFHVYQDFRALNGKTVFPWAPAETHTDI